MSLLSELVQSLFPEELACIKKMRLEGKQKAVFDLVIERHHATPTPEEEAKQIGITLNHLYSIQSILLQRCYKVLVPEGGALLLIFLQTRGLGLHCKKEILAQEKELFEKNADPLKLERFYLQTLNVLQAVTLAHFTPKVLVEFRDRFLAVGQPEHSHNSYHIKVRELLFKEILVTSNPKKKKPQEIQYIKDELMRLEKGLAGSDHPMAPYFLESAFIIYYALLEPDMTKQESHLLKALSLTGNLPTLLRSEEKIRMSLRIANLKLSMGEFREALELYEMQYEKHGIELFRMFGYHLDRLVRLYLIAGKYAKAEELLEKGYENHIRRGGSHVATAGAIFHIELSLLRRDPNRCKRYLEKAFQLNSGSAFAVDLEIEIRLLQVMYHYLIGDLDFIYHLVTRAQKYLQRKGIKVSTSKKVQWFLSIREIVKAYQHHQDPPSYVMDTINNLLKGQDAVLGLLLRRLIDKDVPAHI
jgi:tetratricopeptide (TPR) repeat protein